MGRWLTRQVLRQQRLDAGAIFEPGCGIGISLQSLAAGEAGEPAQGRHGEGGVLYKIAARHAAAMIDLIESGVLAGRGPIRQEDIDASLILSNPKIQALFK